MRVGICQWHPPTLWRRGGGENLAHKYREHLNRVEGIEAEFFVPHDPQPIDILHIIGTNYHLNEFAAYARPQGIKTVLTPIAYSRHAPWKFKLVLATLAKARLRTPLAMRREILHDADLVLAFTNAEKRFLAAAYGVPLQRIDVVGIGAELGEFLDPDPRLFVDSYGIQDFVLSVGRVNAYKGQLPMLQALRELPYPIVLIGQPDASQTDYAAAVRAIVDSSPHITWLQDVPAGSPILPSAYAASRCHVQFSRGEVASLVNLEAMAAGTLVVAKPLETTREMLGDLVFYAANAKELRSTVEKIYACSPEHRASLIRKGRELATSQFSWECVAKKLASCYKRLL